VRVFQTFNRNEARYAIHITQNKGKADLCVYLVNNRALAYDESRWFICNSKAESQVVLYFGNAGASKLNIHFVKQPAQAGWQRSHPMQGRLK